MALKAVVQLLHINQSLLKHLLTWPSIKAMCGKTCGNFSEHLAIVSWSWTQDIEWCQDLLSLQKPWCIAPCVSRLHCLTPRFGSQQKCLGFCSNSDDWSVNTLPACVCLFWKLKCRKTWNLITLRCVHQPIVLAPRWPWCWKRNRGIAKHRKSVQNAKELGRGTRPGCFSKKTGCCLVTWIETWNGCSTFSRHHFGLPVVNRNETTRQLWGFYSILFSLVVHETAFGKTQPTNVVAVMQYQYTHTHTHTHWW